MEYSYAKEMADLPLFFTVGFAVTVLGIMAGTALVANTPKDGPLKTKHIVRLTVGGLLIAPVIFMAEYMIFLLSFDKYGGWGLSNTLTAVVYYGISGALTAADAVLAAVGVRTLRRREAKSGGIVSYALGLSVGAASLLMALLPAIDIFKR